jgi:orotidine-5'-phosphate decarboxylase
VATPDLARARGIVALDGGAWPEAERLVSSLGPHVEFYKVGLELFTAEGPESVRRLLALGKRVFLDLKLHDIPNTVAGAARRAAALGVELVTVHAAGGPAMVRAAVEGGGGQVSILAVTMLTSLAEGALPAHFRRDRPLPELVLELTEEAIAAGARGVVLSGAEVRGVKERFGGRCLCVVPGVRAGGAEAHDQARVVTPSQALAAGADYLVLGRAVTQAPDPARSWREIWGLDAAS